MYNKSNESEERMRKRWMRWWMIALLAAPVPMLLRIAYAHLHDYQRQRITTFLHPESDPRGECVLCVYCRASARAADAPDLEALLKNLLSSGLSVRDAAAEAAKACDVPKKEAYAKALEITKTSFS